MERIMSKKRRYFLIGLRIGLTLLFFIITPYIIMKIQGLRYNPQSGGFEKTGILLLKALPRNDLKIYLGGKLQEKKGTPAKFILSPGLYSVRIEKEGHSLWQKNIFIKEGITLWQENIVLFPQNIPSEILDEGIGEFGLDKERKTLVYIKDKREIWILDLETNKKTKIFSLSGPKSKPLSGLQLSGGGKTIIFFQDSFKAINLENPQKVLVIKKEDLKFKKVSIDPVDEKKIWLLTSKNQLYNFNIDSGDYKPLTNEISNFDFSENKIFLISKKDTRVFLGQANLDLTNLETLSELPKGNYEVLPNLKFPRLALISSQKGILYIYAEGKLEKIKDEVKEAFWSKDGQKLLYRSDFEIWVYFFEKEDKPQRLNSFITRFSKKLDKVAFYPDFEHILFLSEGKLADLEIDGTNYLEFPWPVVPESNLIIDPKNYFLYLVQKTKKNQELLLIKFPKPEPYLGIFDFFAT